MFTFGKNFFLLREELFHNFYSADIRQFLVFIILEYINFTFIHKEYFYWLKSLDWLFFLAL